MTVKYDATYSPEDNKLRLRASDRLDKDLYERVRAAGFAWAPKQDLFVAPMWTPEREDLLIELCGEVGDEDTSLVERAEERAERFEGYHENRKADAEAAHEAVKAIADNIPLGQPILVGHHSEKHARRDAEKIKNGMTKAVKMWDTAEYWMRRAKGAIRHAKYKERPDVRHRRIKKIEAELRKVTKERQLHSNMLGAWAKLNLTREQAIAIANFDRVYIPGTQSSLWYALDRNEITAEQAAEHAIKQHTSQLDRAKRWAEHCENRLAYERAMLDESGGIVADKFPIEVGGRVLCSGWRQRKGYLVVMRVTKKDGVISSVRTTEGLVSVEEITDYKAPEGDDAEKVKAATKLPPLVNYPGEGFRHMTKGEFDKSKRHSDFYCVRKIEANDKHGAHRLRQAPKEGGPYYNTTYVYLTDQKRVDPPAPATTPADVEAHAEALAPMSAPVSGLPPRTKPRIERTKFDDMRDSLKAGVQVVSAPQLFPTPPDLAARMVQLADIQPQHSVLEPSAGTGSLLKAIHPKAPLSVAAIEIDQQLTRALTAQFPYTKVFGHDFLEYNRSGYTRFDRIIMNPPFENGADVKHVLHAWNMLAEGGVLVAIMSAGVKFHTNSDTTVLRELIDEHGSMEDLPDDTFKAQGTSVRTVLITLRK